MRVFYGTDVGLVRASNQDCVNGGVFDDGAAWAVVCDGMGGANGGEYASSQAVAVISAELSSGYQNGMTGRQIHELIYDAIDKANGVVYNESQRDAALAGMGTTVVAAIVCDGDLYIAHAGDSRAYVISEGHLSRITKDHSMVQEMVDLGQITESEAENHPRKNVITRALGVCSYIDVDFNDVRIGDNDIVLLCSDGLSNCVSAADISKTAVEVSPEELPQKYIALACDNGGTDNISAVIICR